MISLAKNGRLKASKLLASAAAAVMAASSVSVSAFAEEINAAVAAEKNSDISFEVIESEIFYPEDGFSLTTGAVDLRSGKYERWIERVVLPDEVEKFYYNLYHWTNGDGSNDLLIDISSLETKSSSGKQYYAAKAFEVITDAPLSISDSNYYFAASRAAYDAFDRDHPEVFWLNGRTKMLAEPDPDFTDEGKIKYKFYFLVSSFDGTFNIFNDEYQSADAIRNGIAKREEYIEKINMDEVHSAGYYQQVKAFNKWLTEHNEYNTIVASGGSGEGDMVRECMSALEGRTGNDGPVCEAYARAMKVLCDRAMIPCILVDGVAGEDHMWNYIKMGDGNWYLVDVTWNDPTGESSGAISGAECEDYLLIGSANSLLKGREITNKASSKGVSFLNQPDLAVNDYVPSEDEAEHAVLEADEGAVIWYIGSDGGEEKQVYNGDKLEWGGGIRVEIPVSVAPTKPNIFVDNWLHDCYRSGDSWVSGIDEYDEVPIESKMTVKFNLQDDAIDFVERLYQNTLNRGSDPSGLSTHVRDLKNGDSASTVAYRFVFSSEFQNANLSNEEIVKRMYNMFLSRDPDPAGLENWVNILEKGCSVGYLFYGFTQSKEFGELCDSYGFVKGNWQPEENRDKSPNLTAFVSRLYEKILGRTPDVGGLNNHTGAYLENRDTYQLAYNFIFSSEFTNKKLSDSDYVDTLYRTFFNREPDNGGKADWLNRITTQGYSREDVLAGFVGSQECIDLVNSFGI